MTLQIRGAREHNLRGLDLDLPTGVLVVFTGVSGSGKSSLAFDTLYAEASRRFVEALPGTLRSRLGALRKPAFDWIGGLPPAIGVPQRSTSPGARATLGTLTEIHDLLRVLYTHRGQQHCPTCDRPVYTDSADGIVRRLLALPEGTRLTVGAPVQRGRVGSVAGVIDEVRRSGFSRVRLDGKVVEVEELPPVDARLPHDLDVVVDRVKVAPDRKERLQDSVATALRAGRDAVVAWWDGGEGAWGTRPRCPVCDLDLPALSPRLFSFNTPLGACTRCEGLGTVRDLPLERLVTPELTLTQGALDGAAAPAKERGIPLDVPWSQLPWQDREWLLHGGDGFEGVLPALRRRAARPDPPEKLARLVVVSPCEACGGSRLAPAARAVRLGGWGLPRLLEAPLEEAAAHLAGLDRDPVSAPVLDELGRRLGVLLRCGLGHLGLGRAAPTLSTGELQRARLSTAIGNQLSGVLYVLDEPTAGLGAAETQALLAVLADLRAQGNTVLLVEHDPDVVRAADLVVDFGPGPGRDGGQVLYQGPPSGLTDTTTGRWLHGRERLPGPRPVAEAGHLLLRGARGHNLKGVDLAVPLGALTVVTGPSGAGKSTLVEDTLGRAVARHLGLGGPDPLPHDGLDGADALRRLVRADAGGPSRSARSNVATWTRTWDEIRALYARTPEAKVRGWGPERFSLVVPGGRCEACAGEGTQRVEMYLLPALAVPCEVCEGRRFEESTLAVAWRGATIADVLTMSVREARSLFAAHVGIAGPLAVLDELGLGYLPLGQPGDTWSGGEAQRLGLARELSRPGELPGTLFLLDEPSVGLHPADVAVLLAALRRLVEKGATVLLVEHDPALVAACDRQYRLGPGAGPAGGRLVG